MGQAQSGIAQPAAELRPGAEPPPAAAPSETLPETPVDAPVPAKVLRYAQRMISSYDTNADARLVPDEWARMKGSPRAIDRDGDGAITVAEMAQYVANFGRRRKVRLLSTPADDAAANQPLLRPAAPIPEGGATQGESVGESRGPAGLVFDPPTPREPGQDRRFHVPPERRPAGLPDWFNARDANGDGQLTMAEFAPKATQADRADFARYDADGDGLLTPDECLRRWTPPPTEGKVEDKTK
ncbi:MAG: hypothetical protein JW809_06905 [Pirellulales bacterium]|nr:hypothetical protein [Pirellulales bacterium]